MWRWVSALRGTLASMASATMGSAPLDRSGGPARMRSNAARIWSRSSGAGVGEAGCGGGGREGAAGGGAGQAAAVPEVVVQGGDGVGDRAGGLEVDEVVDTATAA